jgi:hypothetical protein
MRRKVILGVVIVLVALVGYLGYLLSRDPRQYALSEGSAAVIATKSDDNILLQDSSSEDVVPILRNGDEVKVIKDSADDPSDRTRKVSIQVESGKFKGLSGTVMRLNIRPTSLFRGRADF